MNEPIAIEELLYNKYNIEMGNCILKFRKTNELFYFHLLII